MPYLLKNKSIELHLYAPDENYHLPRFDWTGKIFEVKYEGIPLAGYEKEVTEAGDFAGRGFYNEFGIEKAIGFAECKPGDWFHKIGVGLLQKEGADYLFHHPYKIRPSEWVIEKTEESIAFSCSAPLVNGYAYEYKKTIQLTDQGVDIHYQLKNTGEKLIDTNEYNHNFIRIADQPIGPGYVLKFVFSLQPGSTGEYLNPKNVIEFHEMEMKLTGIPDSPFFFSFLNGKEPVRAQWELINTSLGIGIKEVGSFSTSKVNLWGWQGAISPELFIAIKLPPGETKSWTRSYTMFKTG
jgi:hypothetical protein